MSKRIYHNPKLRKNKGEIMGDYRITCRKVDRNGVLTHVGISNKRYTVKEIIDWINNKEHSFYTYEDNTKAIVEVVGSPPNEYLRSRADKTVHNNLDELPDCHPVIT